MTDHGRIIFDELRLGISQIERLSDATRGVVRVETTEPLTNVISDIICGMKRPYPQVTSEVTVSDTDTLARLLRDRSLDAPITRWIAPLVSDDLSGQVPYPSRPAAVPSQSNHTALGQQCDDLEDAPLVAPVTQARKDRVRLVQHGLRLISVVRGVPAVMQ